jgi:hypothetical protein
MNGIVQFQPCRPRGSLQYEPMFALTKRIPKATADFIDLALEFATLGEYGLEYPDEGQPVAPCSSASVSGDCRSEPGHGRPARARSCHPGPIGGQSAVGLPEALRPPRLRLECLGD